MDRWVNKTINDCCEILDHSRIPLNEQQRGEIPGNIPYYGANGIQGYIDKYIFDEDLILIAEDGGYFEEFATRPIAYKISGKSWVNNHAHVIRAKKGFEQDFIFYSLVHKNILVFIVGGTRSKLNQAELKSITIQLPPTTVEQTAIARILGTVDKAIEQTEQLIAKYQRIKTGLMQDLLTRGIDEHGRIRSEVTHRFKDTQLGRIPEEWEVVRVEDLCDVTSSKRIFYRDYKTEGIPFYRSKEIIELEEYSKTESSLFIEESKYHEIGKKFGIPCASDILITSVGTLGVCYLVKPDDKFYFKDGNLIWLRNFKKTLNPKFVIRILPKMIEIQFDDLVIGSSQKAFTIEKLKKLLVSLPDNQEQKRVTNILTKTDMKISRETYWLSKLQRIKTGLMQDLLSGRMRVPAGMIERIGKAGEAKTA